MRLVHSDYGIEMEIKENKVNVLILESPVLFANAVREFKEQCSNDNGCFILSDKEKIMRLDKIAEIILSPFTLECNSRKVIQHLYQEICDYANDNLQEETGRVYSQLALYMEKLIDGMPYSLSYSMEENITGLLKLGNVKIEEAELPLLEELVNYIQLMSRLCAVKILIFVNLKCYLSEEELSLLYEIAFYNKIQLVLLENTQRASTQKFLSDNENTCIMDRDMCIIQL